MNSVILIGRIGKDLELKKTQSGKSVINFSLAVNKFSKGEEKSVDWINCQAWNKTAEIMHTYLSKGSQIAVEGRIQTRNYEDNTGRKVYVTEVIVDRFEFLESRKNNEDDYEQQSNELHRQAPELDITSDDLPF